MTLIYTSTKSKVKPKNTAKKKQLEADWNNLLRKWDVKPQTTTKTKQLSGLPDLRNKRSTVFDAIPRSASSGIAVKKPTQQYTGDQCIGIATLHKSNGVPVFKQEDAEDIARMRR